MKNGNDLKLSHELMAFPLAAMVPGKMNVITGQQEAAMILQGGMTLRDYFAGQAINGMLSAFIVNEDDPNPDANNYREYYPAFIKGRAVDAYAMADAMLLARIGGPMTLDKG